ncbi:MAG TPA: transcription termination factor Rho [Bacillota bacterium]|nr:transcription termination factor Rho [Bacillota bacterium]HOA14855.1 transcription termination factor Rho [Bacillota bacterium]
MKDRISELGAKSVLELKDEAKAHGVKGFRTLRKAELIDALTAIYREEGAKPQVPAAKAAQRGRPRKNRTETEEARTVEPVSFKIIGVVGDDGELGSAKDIEDVSRMLASGKLDGPETIISSRPVLRRRSKAGEAAEPDQGPATTALPSEEETSVREEPAAAAQAAPQREAQLPSHMKDGAMSAKGVLVIKPEGYGFLRANQPHTQGFDDIYISPSQIKRFRLRNGDEVAGYVRPPNEGEKNSALIRVESVNDDPPEYCETRKYFEDLTPIFPKQRIKLETQSSEITGRVIDLMVPIGMGQRGMIVAQPKVGKTTVMKTVARALMDNSPDIRLIVLLVDERPEEVTDWIQWIGDKGQVFSSTFDQPAENHTRVAEIVLEIAKRQVEHRKNVCILLDSLTRLTRAYNTTTPSSGRTLSGGLDPSALHPAKRFFGAARNIQDGGSLTILATCLVDTGSRMDDMIYEEFKGTGNMEIHLERELADRRIFPAIDIKASSTRRDELLYTPKEREAAWVLRVAMASMSPQEQTEFLFGRVRKTASNDELIDTIVNSKYASNMKERGTVY